MLAIVARYPFPFPHLVATLSLQGFLDLRIRPWVRNMLTRSLAIVPSLAVALIGGSAGAGELIIIASVFKLFSFFY